MDDFQVKWHNRLMIDQWGTVHISVAHLDGAGRRVGSNLRIDLGVTLQDKGDFDFSSFHSWLKQRLDHQSLDVTVPEIARSLGKELFQQPLSSADWLGLRVTEIERWSIEARPKNPELLYRGRHRNLELAWHGEMDRDSVVAAVERVFPEFQEARGESNEIWLERLFHSLSAHLPRLQSVTVDLGRQDGRWRLARHPAQLDNGSSN